MTYYFANINFYFNIAPMNTFNYFIPTRTFMENGGNIIQATVLTEANINAPRHSVVTRTDNSITIAPLAGGDNLKTHIDLCWVMVQVLM